MSPIHLALPIVELTGEFRINDKMGAAGIVGFGSVTVDDSLGGSSTFSAYELGGSFRYYAVGSFDHGMQVGAEVLFVGADGEVDNVTGVGVGLSIGPFIGYKVAMDVGFTFDAQLGFAYTAVGAAASDGDNTATDSDSNLGPLLNLNVGWSF